MFDEECYAIFFAGFYKGFELMDVAKGAIADSSYPISFPVSGARQGLFDRVNFMRQKICGPRHIDASACKIVIDTMIYLDQIGYGKDRIGKNLKGDGIFLIQRSIFHIGAIVEHVLAIIAKRNIFIDLSFSDK